MSAFGYFLCSVVGILIPYQAATSAALGKRSTFASFAALVSFLIGFIIVFIYFLIETKGTTTIHKSLLVNIEWWIWIGGAIGALYVIIISIYTQKLGAAVLLGIIVVCQLIAATVYDHFGLFELPQRPVRIWNILGLIFACVGVGMIAISEARR